MVQERLVKRVIYINFRQKKEKKKEMDIIHICTCGTGPLCIHKKTLCNFSTFSSISAYHHPSLNLDNGI